jgi:hypothetical protein
MSNWSLAAGLGRLAGGLAWQSRIGKGAITGAGVGAAYGMFAGDSSFLGGAIRGAGTGALIGGSRGWALGSTLAGAGLNTVMGGSPLWGALAGRGIYGAGRRYGVPAAGIYKTTRMISGAGPAMRMAGQHAYQLAARDARRSARYIGNTARKAYGRIQGIFSKGPPA